MITNEIIKENIIGARNIKTYLSSFVLFVVGLAFLLVGISSYFQTNFLFFTNSSEIVFYPQGIVMTFYGMAALVLSFYLAFTIYLNLGSGYNEFSKKDEIVRIVRLGFPGKNRNIFLSYKFNNIKSVKFLLKQGLNPRTNILLILKDQRQIPLFPSNILLKASDIENKAIELANFLEVPLESSIS
jgi:hypothetical protein